MKICKDSSKSEPSFTSSNQMKIGDVAEVLSGGYKGKYILVVFNYIVSLTEPRDTWYHDSSQTDALFASVRILPKGTILTIEV